MRITCCVWGGAYQCRDGQPVTADFRPSSKPHPLLVDPNDEKHTRLTRNSQESTSTSYATGRLQVLMVDTDEHATSSSSPVGIWHANAWHCGEIWAVWRVGST